MLNTTKMWIILIVMFLTSCGVECKYKIKSVSKGNNFIIYAATGYRVGDTVLYSEEQCIVVDVIKE